MTSNACCTVVAVAEAGGSGPTRRVANLAGFAACASMMAYALYAQHVLHLSPCNMCMLERIGVIALGVAFLLAALHNPRRPGAYAYAALVALATLVAAAAAGRHVWMQLQPLGSLPSCGADFYSMLDMMPFTEVVQRIVTGGGDCQAITWTFAGLSMPAWVLILVVVTGAVGTTANLLLRRPA